MLNETFFFFHLVVSLSFLLFSLRMGKECLIAFLSLSAVLANLFVLKQISFFSWTITSSDVYAVQAILALNMLQEYFGKKTAEKASKISFFCMGFFAIMAKMHLTYIPSSIDYTQEAFVVILDAAPRIVFASLATFYFVQRLDILFFSQLKIWLKNTHFSFRVICSLLVSQTIDTALFAFLGLYGLVANIFSIIAFSLMVKCLVIWMSAPITAFSKKFLKENVHV